MAEETVAQAEVTQGNSTEARTETGAIKDQQATQPPGSANQDPKTSTELKVPEATSTEKKPEAKPGEAATVPDKYEFKAPEGHELDAKAIEAVTPIFKELGLTQDQAQKLVAFQATRDAASADAGMKLVEAQRTEWRSEVIKDPTIGNGTDGLKDSVKADIAKAISSIGDAKAQDAFKQAMDLTGAGDNPAFVRAFAAMGKLLSEGTAVRGGGPSAAGQTAPGAATRPSPAQAMYPKLPTSSVS